MNEDAIEIEYEADTVSFEESGAEEGQESLLTRLGRMLFYGVLLLMPLWFLPVALLPVDLNKAYFATVMIIAALLCALGGILQEGRLRTVSTRVFVLALFFGLATLASSLFSSNYLLSLFGVGYESLTFIHVLIAIAALFLGPIVLCTREQIKKAFFFLMLSVGIAAAFFFVRSVFNISPFPWLFTQERSFTLLGSWNASAIFFGLGVVLFLPMFRVGRHLELVWFLVVAGAVLLANFTSVWIGIGVVALFFVALLLGRQEQRSHSFAIALFALLLSVFFILLGNSLGQAFVSFGRPLDAFPDTGTSLSIAKKVFTNSPIVGSGPNTFALLWDLYKDPAINTSALWQVRFTGGSSAFLTLAAETGILGVLSFLLFIGVFLWFGVRVLGEGGTLVRVSFAGALYLILMWFLYPINFALVLLTFMLMSLFLASSAEAGLLRRVNISLFETKERGFVFSLIIIFLLIGGIVTAYFETTRYLGELAFARGIEIYNKEGSLNGSGNEILSALLFNSSQDRYYRALAQLEYFKIQRAIGDRSLPDAERTSRFQNAYNAALRYAREAYNLNKNDAANSTILGQIYELALPVDPDKAEAAIEHYSRAHDLAPTNPTTFVDIARVYLARADIVLIRGGGTTSQRIAVENRAKAVEYLVKATELKSDYAQANFTLSQLYALQNQLDNAIARAEQTVRLAPNDIGVLFQLGLLYYQRQRFNDAGPLFERAISITPSYSNARYFLGLIYDKKGDAHEALKQFREILTLNPDNEEVKKIITALEAGKKAADVLGQPPPERRPDTPVKESRPPREVPLP